MHENPTDRRDPPSREDEEAKVQRAVLALVLAEHPTRLTFAELAHAVCNDPENFAEATVLADAVRELRVARLLRCAGERLVPTPAALHFDRLGL